MQWYSPCSVPDPWNNCACTTLVHITLVPKQYHLAKADTRPNLFSMKNIGDVSTAMFTVLQKRGFTLYLGSQDSTVSIATRPQAE